MKALHFPFRFYLTFLPSFLLSFLGRKAVYLQVYKSDDYTSLPIKPVKTLSKSRPEEGISDSMKPPCHYEIGRRWIDLIRWRKKTGLSSINCFSEESRRLNKPLKILSGSGPDGKEFRKVRWVNKDEVEEDGIEKSETRDQGCLWKLQAPRLYPNRI